MKIGLYNPYLSSVLGGGERHFLSIAECLSSCHQVDIFVDKYNQKKTKAFKSTFNLNLDKINFINLKFQQLSILDRFNLTKQYDIFYYVTDGSFFISQAKKNIVHFQVPFKSKLCLWQKIKLNTWDTITANSSFTKNWLEKKWHIKVNYLHKGSINLKALKPAIKKNIILSVGRFISDRNNKHCKRQDFLVKSFRSMFDQGLKNWQLILIGNLESGKDNYQFVQKVNKLAKNYPIIIKYNSTFKQLLKEYSQAKIYWHAAGYGVNQAINPQAVEHLGLTTVEAQASGCVPIVINKGGQPEVVTHELNGLLWENQDQLINQTLQLIKDEKKLSKLSRKAIKNSINFSPDNFCKITNQIFSL